MVSMLRRPDQTIRLSGTAHTVQGPAQTASRSTAGLPRTGEACLLASRVTTADGRTALEARKEWMAFLQGSCLLHHADLLMRNGFDDMESLAEIEDADIKDLGIPAHDAMRLRRSLQHLKSQGAQSAHPVVAFLKESGLQQYTELLLRNGFDDMEAMLEMRESDMRELGIARGHALKLAKRLRDYSQDKPVEPAPRHLAPVLGVRQRSSNSPPVPPTEDECSAVQRSWAVVQQMGSAAVAEKLYCYVFKHAPDSMSLFPPEVRARYRDWSADEVGTEDCDPHHSPGLRKLFAKVVNAVGLCVAGLRQPAEMVPMLTQLGARHAGYGPHGVCEDYWRILEEGLVLTLRESLGSQFTQEVQLAWTMVYGFISAVMIEGMRAALAAGEKARPADDRSSVQSVRSTHSARSSTAAMEASFSHDEPSERDGSA